MDHLHLLSLVTPFIDKEDTVMTTHTRINRLGKSGLKAEKELNFVSLPPTEASRTPFHTLGIPQGLDCSRRTLRKSRSCMAILNITVHCLKIKNESLPVHVPNKPIWMNLYLKRTTIIVYVIVHFNYFWNFRVFSLDSIMVLKFSMPSLLTVGNSAPFGESEDRVLETENPHRPLNHHQLKYEQAVK
jgi:hypothetical protein